MGIRQADPEAQSPARLRLRSTRAPTAPTEKASRHASRTHRASVLRSGGSTSGMVALYGCCCAGAGARRCRPSLTPSVRGWNGCASSCGSTARSAQANCRSGCRGIGSSVTRNCSGRQQRWQLSASLSLVEKQPGGGRTSTEVRSIKSSAPRARLALPRCGPSRANRSFADVLRALPAAFAPAIVNVRPELTADGAGHPPPSQPAPARHMTMDRDAVRTECRGQL